MYDREYISNEKRKCCTHCCVPSSALRANTITHHLPRTSPQHLPRFCGRCSRDSSFEFRVSYAKSSGGRKTYPVVRQRHLTHQEPNLVCRDSGLRTTLTETSVGYVERIVSRTSGRLLQTTTTMGGSGWRASSRCAARCKTRAEVP